MESPSDWSSGVLDPHGPVAAAERTILLNGCAVMAAVIVPVIVLTLAFAWWFRAGNKAAARRPDWSYSGPIEVTVWSIPILVILFLGGVAWVGAHELDPARPLESAVPPLEVQVVSLDWKWLFIYPDLGVASVNRLTVPQGVPLKLHLTSASVMNSFFVPQLGGQIYTMAGMTTTLHLLAGTPGTSPGLSAQFSGDGFSDMRFDVVALPAAGFGDWLAAMRAGPHTLDADTYVRLAKPGPAEPGAEVGYAHVSPHLFGAIVQASSSPLQLGAALAGSMAASMPMAMTPRSD